jgi:hypothetical protein
MFMGRQARVSAWLHRARTMHWCFAAGPQRRSAGVKNVFMQKCLSDGGNQVCGYWGGQVVEDLLRRRGPTV